MSFVRTTNLNPESAPPAIHRASYINERSIDKVHCTYILAIPAVGADPQSTWGGDDQWLFKLHKDISNTILLQYDHLKDDEKHSFETAAGPHDVTKNASTNPWDSLKEFKVEDWSKRFLEALEKQTFVKSFNILVICHSTGGIVLKDAFNRSDLPISRTLKSKCVLLAFLATPHHGSELLSDPRMQPAIRQALNLKDVIGSTFSAQMEPFNHYLESLNQNFCYHSLGISLWTYGEKHMTKLSGEMPWSVPALGMWADSYVSGSPQPQTLEQFIVDSASSEVKNIDHHVLVDEEEWDELRSDHMGAARLANSVQSRDEFINDVKDLLKDTSLEDYTRHRDLLKQIFRDVNVEQHLIKPQVIGGRTKRVAIESHATSLQAFIEPGNRISEAVESSPINVLNRFVTEDAAANNPNQRRSVSDRRNPAMGERPSQGGQQKPSSQKPPIPGLAPPVRSGTSSSLRPSAMPRRISTSKRSFDKDEPDIPYFHNSGEFTGPAIYQVPEPERLARAGFLLGEETKRTIDRRSSAPEIPQISETPEIPAHQPEPFNWYHVAHCVPSWVPLIMNALSIRSGSTKLHKQVLKEDVWLGHHNNPTHDSFHGNFVHPHVQALMPRRLHSTDEMLAPSSSSNQPQFALYLPYLHWDTFKSLEKRKYVAKLRTLVEEKEKGAREVRPVVDEILETPSLEHKVIWQYLTSGIPMHARRTLDMYGYPSLRNTDERDGDQVLYKYTKSIQEASPEQQTVEKYRARLSRRTQKPKDEPESLPLAVLMVDTLWLWILADDTILTFAPRRESSSDSKSFNTYQADPVINVLQALTVERRAEVNDCFDLAALIVFYCVESLLKGSVDSNLKVFRIFEGFTSDKVEEQTASYKAFRKAQKSERREFDNGDDLNNLLELRDISDELNVILVLLTQQRDQVQNIIDIYEKKINTQSRGGLGTDLLKATKTRLKDYISLTEKLIESSTKAQDSYDKLLSLKEAHSGVLEARTASEQARIVNIFTVVTIVFSPLSFFSGIFGMNVSDWSGTETNLELFYVLKIMLSISLSLIAMLLLVAFNIQTRKLFIRLSRRLAGLWLTVRLFWHALKDVKALEKSMKDVGAESHNEEGKPSEKPRKLWQGRKLENQGAGDAELGSSEPVSPKGNGVVMN